MKSWKTKQKQAAKLIKKWRHEDLNMIIPGLYTHTAWLHCYEVKKKGRALYLTYICAATGVFVINKIKAHYNYSFLTFIGEV